MPDRDAAERQSERQLTAMIWAGVGLVPVAVLIVLVGGGDTSLRFAVLLMAVSVVLVGASLLIRNDPELLRMDVADRVAEQADALREEMREEVAAAARATHHRVQTLQDELARLRPDWVPPGSVWPDPVPAGPVASPGHPPEPRTPVGSRTVVAAAQVPRPPAGRAHQSDGPAGVVRAREVAGPGRPVLPRVPGAVPVARAAAVVRPVGGVARVPAAAPQDAPAAEPSRTAGAEPAGRRARADDDVRRTRRGERRGRRSADRDVEDLDAAPSSWLAEPDSGWLIRPEEVGAPAADGDAPWSYEGQPSRHHRAADDGYDTEPGGDGTRYGPGRRRRRSAGDADGAW